MRRLKAVESELAARDANLELKQYKDRQKEEDRLNDIKIAGIIAIYVNNNLLLHDSQNCRTAYRGHTRGGKVMI